MYTASYVASEITRVKAVGVLQQALVQPQEAAQERKEGEHGTV